ncbi:acid phosphatase SurE, putative [Oceaniovalibus guishaninsula JLT2003]|uniref:5'-nucleotidase SurE n=1 Tax=Oceaniovalibus guishaninsula JLT2003 TaxID=1231392 RepID=K2HQP5_9RHOB|nr:5'/3'-nucleotidase SurE [Oceaniovalibus guishaninsula]EKE45094.1 acid phosphatase SurE, putative [Oceaniovalibus guishaninsula JLT2003]
MRILITNDDGINAPGLEVLDRIAAEIAGPDGEVWTVAPAFEQSGVGHCISYTHPMMIAELAPRRWAAEGSPADCVLAALHDILPARPDLVLSGVNRGNNAAENVLYSGTVGGAMEAALQGIPAIALSQFFGPANGRAPDPFEAAGRWGVRTVRAILDTMPRTEDDGYRLFWNVNFPPCPAGDVRGLSAAAQGFRPGTAFTTESHVSPAGRRFLWIRGGDQQVATAPGTDAAVNLDNRISVTPMRADLTDRAALASLSKAFE